MADETAAGALLVAAQACIDVISQSMIRKSGNPVFRKDHAQTKR